MTDDALDPQTVRELRAYADGVNPADRRHGDRGERHRRGYAPPRLAHHACPSCRRPDPRSRRGGGRGRWHPAEHRAATGYRGVLVPAPDLLVPRGRPLLVLLADGRVLVAGGDAGYCLDAACSSATTTTTAEVFDPATGRTARAGAMASADHLVLSSAVLLRDGRVLLVGDVGPADAPPFAVAQVFDPATMTFASRGPDGHAAVTGEAGAAPGRARPGRRRNAANGQQHHPRNRRALRSRDRDVLGDGIDGHTAGVPLDDDAPDGRVLVTGGDNVDTAEIYDPTTGSFAPAGSAPQIKGLNLPVLLSDGRVVLIGQRNGSIS